MRPLILYLMLCLLVGLVPFFVKGAEAINQELVFPGWPTQFEGNTLRPIPLSDKELMFARGFPGKIQRFSDGEREFIVRWLTRSTRKLHSASDCLRGVGYRIKPLPLTTDLQGDTWSTFLASKKGEHLRVYERTYDSSGNNWSDVSAWYWAALLGKSKGPWWSVTIAEIDDHKDT